jgi:hypothetical protein
VVPAERFRGIVVTLADDDAGIVQGIASAEILAARSTPRLVIVPSQK